MPENKKHYVYSARTTEKGLALLNKTKGNDKSWDQFVNDAIAAHYDLPLEVIALPPSKFLEEQKANREAKAAEKTTKKAAADKAKADKAAAKKAADKAKADKAKADKAKADKAKADKAKKAKADKAKADKAVEEPANPVETQAEEVPAITDEQRAEADIQQTTGS